MFTDAQAFSSCSKQAALSSYNAQASHFVGFSCCRAQALGAQALVVVVHGLGCSEACGILPDQGLNLFMSPALTGRFLTTRPPGKPSFLKKYINHYHTERKQN